MTTCLPRPWLPCYCSLLPYLLRWMTNQWLETGERTNGAELDYWGACLYSITNRFPPTPRLPLNSTQWHIPMASATAKATSSSSKDHRGEKHTSHIGKSPAKLLKLQSEPMEDTSVYIIPANHGLTTHALDPAEPGYILDALEHNIHRVDWILFGKKWSRAISKSRLLIG